MHLAIVTPKTRRFYIYIDRIERNTHTYTHIHTYIDVYINVLALPVCAFVWQWNSSFYCSSFHWLCSMLCHAMLCCVMQSTHYFCFMLRQFINAVPLFKRDRCTHLTVTITIILAKIITTTSVCCTYIQMRVNRIFALSRNWGIIWILFCCVRASNLHLLLLHLWGVSWAGLGWATLQRLTARIVCDCWPQLEIYIPTHKHYALRILLADFYCTYAPYIHTYVFTYMFT